MEVKCGWVNFSTNDLCKSVPERNVSIPFHLDSTTKTTDKCLMWVLSATLYAKAVWEEWSHRRIRLDLALLCCMWQIARTATSARQGSTSIRQLRPLAKCLWTKTAISDTSVMLLWPDCAYQIHNEGISALLQAITPLQQEALEP